MRRTTAQEWARNQVDAHVLRTMSVPMEPPPTAAYARSVAEWGCPKCRQQYRDLPRTYTCFCGKVEDPEWWVAAVGLGFGACF